MAGARPSGHAEKLAGSNSLAKRRSLLELRTALDLAGQGYSFGQGAYGQFSQRSKADAFSTAQ